MTVITPDFVLSSLVVIVTPGPDLSLITQLVLRRGSRSPAMVAALGMITAGAAQVLVGFAGVTLLLQREPRLMAAVLWAGAVVLAVWGVLILRAAARPQEVSRPAQETSPYGVYLLGLLCTGSNPKVGLFLTAFLPQYVPAEATPGPALAVLAALYLGMGLTWLVTWINFVHYASRNLLLPRVLRFADVLVGSVFILFAVRLALAARRA